MVGDFPVPVKTDDESILTSFSRSAFLTQEKREKHLKGRRKKKALKWPGNNNTHLDGISDSTLGKLLA